jgi:hypothetical protein
MKHASLSIGLLFLGIVAACGGGGGGSPSGQGGDSGVEASSGDASSGDASGGGDRGGLRDAARDAPTEGASDAGHHDASDGGEGGVVLGMPITAPAGQWTWVPFPDAFCGDGSTTGLGVNLSTASSRVLVYMEGGGACWDELTCYSLMTAANFTAGYSQTNFTTDTANAGYLAMPGGFFDRTSATNPFKDYSFVYVPYCTGDIFAGSNVTTLGTHTAHFVGYANMTAYLKRVVPTFPGAERVYLAGSSAGGMGALFNWWQTQALFGPVRVDLIDDSGTYMPADEPVQDLPTENAAWNLVANAPPGCTKCATDRSTLYSLFAAASPMHAGALLSYVQDTTLPTYYGITTMQFEQGLSEVLANDFTPTTNLKYFTNPAAGHVLFFTPQLTTTTVTLEQFLAQMVTDSPSWANVQ